MQLRRLEEGWKLREDITMKKHPRIKVVRRKLRRTGHIQIMYRERLNINHGRQKRMVGKEED